MPAEQLSLANLGEFIGRELGVSKWIAMDQQRVDQFANCTEDHQWIHVDAERAARESPFGGTIAHGYLTLATVAHGLFEILVIPAGISQVLNYGLDKVRFLAPVRTGSRVRNRLRLLSIEAKGGGRTLLTLENTMDIEGHDKPALIAVVLMMALAPVD
jgi:acyl dehydratase